LYILLLAVVAVVIVACPVKFLQEAQEPVWFGRKRFFWGWGS